MRATYGQESTIQQWQIWHIVDPWIRDKEEPILGCWAWSVIASNSVSQSSFHKARDMLRKAKNAKNGHWHTILERWYKDAPHRANLSELDGQKNKSDNTTHLHWKTFPIKLHLRWEKNWHIVSKKENKVRWGNALFFVKRSRRIVNCTKHTLKVQEKEKFNPSSRSNKTKSPTSI